MRYLRIWRRFLTMALVRELEYRLNVLMAVLEGTAQLALAVVTTLLLFQWTPTIEGWSRADMIVLVGLYRFVESLIALQIAPNMFALSRYIRSGELDFILLRPVESQFLVSLRYLRLPQLVNALIGLALALWALNAPGIHYGPGFGLLGYTQAVLAIICGVIMMYSVWFMLVTLSFWLVDVPTLDTLFYAVFETGRYPTIFFRGLVRAMLTWVFPVFFAVSFPAQSLTGDTSWPLALYSVGLAAIFLTASHLFWRYAVRHYSSASS